MKNAAIIGSMRVKVVENVSLAGGLIGSRTVSVVRVIVV